MITVAGLLLIALFSWFGYRRGSLRMGGSLLALYVATLLAHVSSGLGAALSAGMVPLALQRPIGTILIGMVWFVALSIPLELWLRKREKARQEEGLHRLESWDAWVGLGLGGLWGLALCTLILTGVSAAGRAQRAMRRAQAEVSYRERHPGHPWVALDDSQLNLPPADNLEIMTLQVDESVFSALVDKVNPIDARVEKTLADLSVVANDPFLFTLFQSQPKVQALMSHPKLLELASDPGVAAAVRAGDYQALLDQPKLAALLEDRELVGQLKALDIEDTLQKLRAAAAEKP